MVGSGEGGSSRQSAAELGMRLGGDLEEVTIGLCLFASSSGQRVSNAYLLGLGAGIKQ